MRVLADLADQRAAIAFGHRILRLDLLLGVDPGLKGGQKCRVLLGPAIGPDQSLRIHACLRDPRLGPSLIRLYVTN
jgi:hypothetical protein